MGERSLTSTPEAKRQARPRSHTDGQRNPDLRPAPKPGAEIEVMIETVGAQGDGIAEHGGRRLYVPFTVTGDRARVRVLGARGDGVAAEVRDLLAGGPHRGPPACRHFGRCGGCSLQHLDERAYVDWKLARITGPLARAGFAAYRLDPLLRTAPGERRRARFAAIGGGRRRPPMVGFNARRSREIVDLEACPVLESRIFRLLPALRQVAAEVLTAGERGAFAVTRLEGGLDVVVERSRPLELADREALARFATTSDVTRVSWRPAPTAMAEPVVRRRPAIVLFDGDALEVPPGCFLQATVAAETALTAAVKRAVGGARTVADLFCGVGTFALPLARSGARVLAVDADAPAIAALAAAGRSSAVALTAERRDLATAPLPADMLNRFEAVVLDPPRAGARAQVRELAVSTVPTVAVVSCDPDTFARDARVLADGGYRLQRVQPVDQFLWSPHLEVVAVFRR